MESTLREAALLVNARSRRGRSWFAQAEEKLSGLGFHLVESSLCQGAGDFQHKLAEHLEHGTPLIVIGGGDGTLGGAAHAMAGSASVLGVLPMGTGNAFARDLEIESDLDTACKVLMEGKVVRVDVGQMGERSFLNIATCGFSTKIALELEGRSKRLWGRTAYLFSVLRGLSKVRPFRARLTLDGESHEFPSLQVVAGNGRFHAGPFALSEEAGLHTGRLSVYALASAKKSHLLWLAIRLCSGGALKREEILDFQAKEGRIEAEPRQVLTLDGEPCMRTPMDFRTIPAALKVVAPKGWTGNATSET